MLKLEWFKQQNPRYEEYERRLLSTNCFDCLIDITGWGEKDNNWSFVSIGVLSKHDLSWRLSLKGRVKLALSALRGRWQDDMEFTTKEEVTAFVTHLQEVADKTFKE